MFEEKNILEAIIFTGADVKSFLMLVTQLGNSSLLLLITFIVSLWLAAHHYYRAATGLWLSLIITSVIIIATKLFFLGCYEDTTYGIRSPSGHAALSLTVYGMLTRLMGQSCDGAFKAFINVFAVLLIITIAISRYTLGYHTISEILIGLVAGFIGLGVASKYLFTWKQELLRLNIPMLLLVLGAVAYILHGKNLPAESWVKKIAAQLPSHIEACTHSQPGSTSRENSSS